MSYNFTVVDGNGENVEISNWVCIISGWTESRIVLIYVPVCSEEEEVAVEFIYTITR